MSDLAIRVEGAITEEQVDLIKRTIAKDASDDELNLFLYQCKRTGLDPLSKQIYLVKRWNAKTKRNDMAIQTGIDGYRLVADRTGKYAGNDDPVFGSYDSWTESGNEYQVPTSATVTVYKMVAGKRCPFTATARWTEYYPGEKQGFMWRTKPHVMLGKCAEALALRKAFPAELSGVYTAEEMEQAGPTIEAELVPQESQASSTSSASQAVPEQGVGSAESALPEAEPNGGDSPTRVVESSPSPSYSETVRAIGSYIGGDSTRRQIVQSAIKAAYKGLSLTPPAKLDTAEDYAACEEDLLKDVLHDLDEAAKASA